MFENRSRSPITEIKTRVKNQQDSSHEKPGFSIKKHPVEHKKQLEESCKTFPQLTNSFQKYKIQTTQYIDRNKKLDIIFGD